MIKTSLKSESRESRIAKTEAVLAAIEDNPNFPVPNPPLAEVSATVSALKSKLSELTQLRAEVKTTLAEVRKLEKQLQHEYRSLGAYVTSIAGQDERKVISAGFQMRSPGKNATPKQVKSLEAVFGPDSGMVALDWKAMRAPHGYEIQTAESGGIEHGDGEDAEPGEARDSSLQWRYAGFSTKSKTVLDGYESGSRCWFRVRIVGTRDRHGPWSDPAVTTVP